MAEPLTFVVGSLQCSIYKDLAPGTRFRFPTTGDASTCTKLTGRWYVTADGLKFAASPRTVVVLVNDDEA